MTLQLVTTRLEPTRLSTGQKNVQYMCIQVHGTQAMKLTTSIFVSR